LRRLLPARCAIMPARSGSSGSHMRPFWDIKSDFTVSRFPGWCPARTSEVADQTSESDRRLDPQPPRLAFLVAGNMAIAASSQGGAMVRVDPQQSDALVAMTRASLVEMRGRPMPGWLHVSSGDLLTDDQLTPWVDRATGYARSLPPKQ